MWSRPSRFPIDLIVARICVHLRHNCNSMKVLMYILCTSGECKGARAHNLR